MEALLDNFARSFGDALRRFLDKNQITVTEAASRLGMNKQTLSSYWTDNSDGKRPSARAELLFLACAKLGFVFELDGWCVSATSSESSVATSPSSHGRGEQLRLPFAQEFTLTDEKGSVSVSLKKRPAGEIQLWVKLKAVS